MVVINLTKSDKIIDLDFTVTDADGDVVDISGSTVAFRVAKPGNTPIISGACTGMNVSGQCTYTIVAGDLSEEGIFDAELEITTGTQIITARDIVVKVGGQLG